MFGQFATYEDDLTTNYLNEVKAANVALASGSCLGYRVSR